VIFAAFALVLLYWAKWGPYWQKLPAVATSHSLGASILTGKSVLPPAPSIQAGLSYSFAYFKSIWTALVAGLLIAAAIEAVIPRHWLLKVMASGGPVRRVLVGGALSVPGMMCTCCAAPPVVALRRSGVPLAASLAYWLGNPSINLAVFAFAALVLPWQLVALRVASGLVLVFVAVPVVSRLVIPAEERLTETSFAPIASAAPPVSPIAVGRRFVGSVVRLAVTLVPEYVVIVFALGAFRGFLFQPAHVSGLMSVGVTAIFAVAGTLFAIPTAGEVPIVQGLLKAGIGNGPAAALLLTLPAISLPSLLMVGRSFPRSATLAAAGAVVVIGVVDGLVAPLLLK
jgi:uncharacterized protein